MSYLGSLTLRLAVGAMRIDEGTRRRHAALLAGRQNEDGGFSGRQGGSDLYYTGFALRGLALMGELTEVVATRAAEFLESRLAGRMPSVDFLSLVFSAVLLEVTCGIDVFRRAGLDRNNLAGERVRPLRRADGGYAKSAASGPSSTYHTFLVAACLDLMGVPLDHPAEMAEFVRSQRREDGGFVELGPLKQSGTNPTAAAVGVLRLLGALDETTRRGAIQFLSQMQNAEGGIRANTRIPVADLLSTFTGMVALADLDALETFDTTAARRYCGALAQPGGGFRGAAWDDTEDVEYTSYGLGCLALLETGSPD